MLHNRQSKDGAVAKTCSKCGATKTRAEFYRAKRYKDGRHPQCKECRSAYTREWASRPGVKERQASLYREWAATHPRENSRRGIVGKADRLKQKYGLTLGQHMEMYATQDGRCAVCGEALAYSEACVDHDHRTGKIRGLVHRVCNLVVAYVENTPGCVESALEYLKRHNAEAATA